MVEIGEEQWSWLGDARRAAVMKCPRGGGGVRSPPTACIARGPDGTKGFFPRRTRRVAKVEETCTKAEASSDEGFPRLDFALGLGGFLIAILLAVSFPWPAAAVVTFFGLDEIGQVKPELVYNLAAVAEAAGGLVLVLGAADWGVEALAAVFRLVHLGGVCSGLTVLALVAGECFLRRLRAEETTPTLGVEVEGEEEEKEEEDVLSCGNRVYPAVNPSGDDVVLFRSVAAAEAGRQRRKASAVMQFKVFDPGGG